MEGMFEGVAGIDIGKATLTVCTPGEWRGSGAASPRDPSFLVAVALWLAKVLKEEDLPQTAN